MISCEYVIVSDYYISHLDLRGTLAVNTNPIPVDLSTVILMYYARMVAEVRKKYANNT